MYEEAVEAEGRIETESAASETEEAEQQNVSFPKDNGWNTITPADQAVQIDDVLYLPGITVAEEMERVTRSSIPYAYSYDPNQLVEPEEQPYIILYREEVPWVSIQIINPMDGMSDLVAKLIEEKEIVLLDEDRAE